MPLLKRITRHAGIPLTLRKKIGKIAGAPKGDGDFEIPVFEAIYTGTHGIHMDDKINLYGLHEASTIRLLRAVLAWQRQGGASPVYWDIGTNSGFHLTAVSPLADHALGFEPWALVREKAAQNITRNDYNHVAVMPFGLSDKDSEIPFHPPANNNFGTGSFQNIDQNTRNDSETVLLQVKRGDTVLDEIEGGHIPTLFKIDIEGHEVPALQGLSKTIHTHRPVIVFEYDDGSRAQLSDSALRETLFDPGYRFYGIQRSREYPRLKPFDPQGKYENVLAWPHDNDPREVLHGFYAL